MTAGRDWEKQKRSIFCFLFYFYFKRKEKKEKDVLIRGFIVPTPHML